MPDELLDAVRSGDLERVRRLAAAGPAALSRSNSHGNGTPLEVALSQGRFEVADVLADAGADLEAPNGGGHTLLDKFAWAGRREAAHWLVARGVAPAFHHLAALDDAGALRRLGDAALAVAPGRKRQTALHAASAAGAVASVAALLDMGADVEARDRAGRTPLAVAVRARQSDVVRTLVGAGAAVGPHVMLDAVRRCPAEIVSTLASVPGAATKAALELAVRRRRRGVAAVLREALRRRAAGATSTRTP